MSNFPLRAPIGLICGAMLGFASIVPLFGVWQHFEPPLEKFYLSQYILSYLSATPIGGVASFFRGSSVRTYHVLAQQGRPVEGTIDPAAGPVLAHLIRINNATAFHAWLRTHIYHGIEAPDLFKKSLAIWCFTLLLFLSVGSVLDFQRRRRSREGKQLRGGELMTVDAFNRAANGDGFALYVRK